jgi:hypothetical protein
VRRGLLPFGREDVLEELSEELPTGEATVVDDDTLDFATGS